MQALVASFLKLFPAYRALEAEVNELRDAFGEVTDEKLRLQDRLDAATADRSRMWDLMTQSIEEMKISYQMHINQSWQRTTGTVPYPDAPHAAQPKPAPPSTEPVGRTGRILPSDRIARRSEEYLESVYGKV